MDVRVNDSVQNYLENESKCLEKLCAVSEVSLEQRLEWARENNERLERTLRDSGTKVEALMDLFANERFQRNIDKERIIELNRENKKLNEKMWKLKELLLDPENKIRMSKDVAEKVFKLLP